MPCPVLTVWQALDNLMVKRQSDLLVVGDGGAVGLLLVHLTVQRGCRVWATAGKKHHTLESAVGKNWRDVQYLNE